MNKLFIHIGTHKTGTTTIQHALRNADVSVCSQEGWNYLHRLKFLKDFMRSHDYSPALVRGFSNELNEKIKGLGKSSVKIISSEALSGSSTSGYMNSGVVAKMLRDATRQFDVKIIVYLRRQDEMVESMYTQMIHAGEAIHFGEFISRLEKGVSYDYYRILQDWISCFEKENLIVRSYSLASQHGLLQDFEEITGSTGIARSTTQRKNPGYSFKAIQIARRANSILDSSSKKRQLRLALQKTMAKQKGEKYSYFAGDDRRIFLKDYEKSNQKVADLFFDGIVENVFPDPVKHSSADGHEVAPDSISYDDAVQLVVELLSNEQPSLGLVAGEKGALSGYQRLKKFLKRILGRV